MTPRITCSMVERWIYLSLDGELFPEREEQLESHLDSCARCRGHFEEAARDQALLEREMDQLSGTVDGLLEERINAQSIARFDRLQAAAAARSQPNLPSWLTPMRFAAALVLLAVMVAFIGSGGWPRSEGLPRAVAALHWSGGEVKWVHSDGVANAAPGGEATLHESEEIEVPSGSTAFVHFKDGTRVQIIPPATFSVRVEGASPAFVMREGAASFEIQEQSRRFLVITPIAIVQALGTSFRLSHQLDRGSARTKLVMRAGSVRIWRVGKPENAILVRAGERAVVNLRSLKHIPKPAEKAPVEKSLGSPPPELPAAAGKAKGASPKANAPPRHGGALDAPAKSARKKEEDDKGGGDGQK